jgi:hypothetical protein
MQLPPWPKITYLPDISAARACAQRGAPWGWRTPQSRVVDPRLAARRLGICVRQATLNAKGGGTQAFLIPAFKEKGSPFDIVVDPNLSPKELVALKRLDPRIQKEFRALVIKFRIAHELGHSFFYSWEPRRRNQRPRMYFAQGRSYPTVTPDPRHDRLEAFCDAFAFEFLAKGRGQPGRSALLDIVLAMNYNQWARQIKP